MGASFVEHYSRHHGCIAASTNGAPGQRFTALCEDAEVLRRRETMPGSAEHPEPLDQRFVLNYTPIEVASNL